MKVTTSTVDISFIVQEIATCPRCVEIFWESLGKVLEIEKRDPKEDPDKRRLNLLIGRDQMWLNYIISGHREDKERLIQEGLENFVINVFN